MWIDSHCHLHLMDFDKMSVDTAITNAIDAKVDAMLCVATTPKQFDTLAELGARERVFTSIGLHPTEDEVPIDAAQWRALAARPDVIAIGETGLDYYRDHDKKLQQKRFEQQIELSNELGLPLIIHTRSAKEDTVAMLRQAKSGAVMHCFTEDTTMARQCLDLGFYISFAGIVTFKNADELRAVAKMVPDDRILVETDTPYLAPVPFRGKQNQPAWVAEVGEFVAQLRNTDLQEFAIKTSDNFYRLFSKAQ